MQEIRGHKLIYKVKVGSHAYGTNIEGSDDDYKGVYIQSPESVLEDGYLPQIEIGKDESYYELRRFVELLMSGNPTMLEMLFAPADTVLIYDLAISNLIAYRYKFLTKKLKLSFGGYAISQITKAKGLSKKMNWEDDQKVRKTVLDFCFIADILDEGSVPLKQWLTENGLQQEHLGLSSLDSFRYGYNVYINLSKEYKGVVSNEETSNDISLSSIPKGRTRVGILYFNKDGYSTHCKLYNEYEVWLKNRNTQRYVDIDEHGQKIDGKNMLHCVRLIDTAVEIAKIGELNVRRPNADYLISIRKGKVSLEDILKYSEEKIKELDELFDNSKLPDTVDEEFFKKLVINIRRRFNEENK